MLFWMRSETYMSKINLQRGKLTVENRKSREKKRICSEVSVNSPGNPWSHFGLQQFTSFLNTVRDWFLYVTFNSSETLVKMCITAHFIGVLSEAVDRGRTGSTASMRTLVYPVSKAVLCNGPGRSRPRAPSLWGPQTAVYLSLISSLYGFWQLKPHFVGISQFDMSDPDWT